MDSVCSFNVLCATSPFPSLGVFSFSFRAQWLVFPSRPGFRIAFCKKTFSLAPSGRSTFYEQALEGCILPDSEQLPNGDHTEVGERQRKI